MLDMLRYTLHDFPMEIVPPEVYSKWNLQLLNDNNMKGGTLVNVNVLSHLVGENKRDIQTNTGPTLHNCDVDDDDGV